ncbi:MAG: UDP-N-acetylmuramoyl-L-alanyl-D-glutamate--2,6-diaminopimelate ligase [Firmicutes bacterium]|jgi:UDP-N-acetylmuramoyl-L-alanyl-D-glutamate--2,6-diaminopimelate ligase|nr:UDP-N-acetylmuramoyl-L-alanyl-D-glutamate--2,6-diaminopimelate ligase [Bacillota bacterium]
MRLKILAQGVTDVDWIGDPDCEVRGVQYDSRQIDPGDLFCAVPGFRTDGHLYCQEAKNRGAVAMLVERAEAVPAGLSGMVVKDVRRAMAQVSDAFFGSPSRRLWMVGVTGTNGKTTVTHLVRSILEAEDIPCGLTGTVHTLIGPEVFKVVRTTPEAPDLQRILRHMADRGMKAAVMEVSSHALALKRVADVRYDVAVFTNLTQDHLDFHKDFEDYYQAKAQLFRGLGHDIDKGPKAAVINCDDPYSVRFAQEVTVPVVTYGLSHEADIRGEQLKIGGSGVEFVAVFPDGHRQPVSFGMTGRFNVQNALAAMAVGYVRHINPQVMAKALAHSPGVPGRFERIDVGQPFTVIVDYAHTPDGLENVLLTAREFALGRVMVVFGAGGDRDQGKRGMMGQVAGRHADWTMLTADNPRSEDPQDIIAQMEHGLSSVGGQWAVELDRERAIRKVLLEAKPGDVILIVGKGHETYQIYRDATIHFDDREVARQVLKEIMKS